MGEHLHVRISRVRIPERLRDGKIFERAFIRRNAAAENKQPAQNKQNTFDDDLGDASGVFIFRSSVFS